MSVTKARPNPVSSALQLPRAGLLCSWIVLTEFAYLYVVWSFLRIIMKSEPV